MDEQCAECVCLVINATDDELAAIAAHFAAATAPTGDDAAPTQPLTAHQPDWQRIARLYKLPAAVVDGGDHEAMERAVHARVILRGV